MSANCKSVSNGLRTGAKNNMQHHIVTDHEDGMRLDRILTRLLSDVPWHRIQHLLRKKSILVDGKASRGDMRLRRNQRITITQKLMSLPCAAATPLDKNEARRIIAQMTLYQDDDILILNKKQHLAVQGGSTLGGFHLDNLLGSAFEERPHLVHRLDKETSGVLLVARHIRAARHLTALFRQKKIFKLYWGITHHAPPHPKGELNDKIHDLEAQTLYYHLGSVRDYGAVAFYPVSGRKHQIRIHAALNDMPLVGDKYVGDKYYGRVNNDKKIPLQLHARMMSVPTLANKPMTFKADPPAAMQKIIKDRADMLIAKEEEASQWFQNYLS